MAFFGQAGSERTRNRSAALGGRGKTNHQIAAKVDVSERTVHFHLNNAMGQLGVGNRTAAAVLGVIG